MATHSSTLAWKIPWTEEPGRLESMGSQSRTWLSTFFSLFSSSYLLPLMNLFPLYFSVASVFPSFLCSGPQNKSCLRYSQSLRPICSSVSVTSVSFPHTQGPSQSLGTLHLGQYLSFSDSCPSLSVVPPFLCLECPTELIACFLVGHEASICHVASIYHVSFNSHTTAPGVPPACSGAGNQSGCMTLSSESLCSLSLRFGWLSLTSTCQRLPTKAQVKLCRDFPRQSNVSLLWTLTGVLYPAFK